MREDANSKLAAVVTDVRGRSARAILQRLLAGETDARARALAELARPEAAGQAGRPGPGGRWTAAGQQAHHVFPLRAQRGQRAHLEHLEHLDAASARVDAELAARLAVEQEALALVQTIPGVGRRTAEVLVASPRSAPISRASPQLSIWLPGPGCAPVTRPCREWWSTPQWADTPRDPLAAAHTGRGRHRRRQDEEHVPDGPISP